MISKIGMVATDTNGVRLGIYKQCAFCTHVFIAKQTGNKTCSPECSKNNRSSKTSKNRKGKTSWNSGKTGVYSQETKDKMGAKNKGKVASQVSKDRQSKSLKRYYETNPHHMKHKSLSEEHRQKISEAFTGLRPVRIQTSIEKLVLYLNDNNMELASHHSVDMMVSKLDTVMLRCTSFGCGIEYSAYVSQIFNGFARTCKSCNNHGSSHQEKSLYEFVKGTTNLNILTNTRPLFMEKSELDLYIPSKNLAIEYHGLAHHSTRPVFDQKDLFKYKNLHIKKYKLCKDQNVKLIQIFEDEWRDKRLIVESMLKYQLSDALYKIHARKCQIKELTSAEASKFQNETHISGFSMAKLYLGLYYNEELVSCISFRKTWNKAYGENVIEIARFSSKLNTQVIGGFQKLLKHAIPLLKSQGIARILTYADCRFGSGDVYKISGFTHLGHTGPNYFYEKGGIRENRFKHRKDNSKPGTEFSQNAENGWYQIYDAGSEIYVLDI
jgi:hypothetical protein